MGRIPKSKLEELLGKALRARKTSTKGKKFEDLICFLLEKVPGISVTKRNVLNPYESEEIDVAAWNEQHPDGFFFISNLILVEAKNWSSPAGSPEIAHFAAKLEERGLEFGFFVALNGITGSAHEDRQDSDKKVLFEPFVGVGPRRFFDLFSMSFGMGENLRRKDKAGKVVEWKPENARQRISMVTRSYREIENDAANQFQTLASGSSTSSANQH